MAYVVWFTGLSGSGKTALAVRLLEYVKKNQIKADLIDGDLTRQFFNDNAVYSRENRINNIKRIVFAAMLLSRNGIFTIVSNIAPYFEVRDFARLKLSNYCQIYLKCSIDQCEKRDVKGLYAKVRRGEMKNVIGIDDRYEEPRKPDLVVNTGEEGIDESFNKIVNYLKDRGII